MRFRCEYQNITYTIRPAYTKVEAGVPVPVKGLRARFVNHLLDTEKAARDNFWTNEERDLVEQTLLRHPDFDRGKIRPDAETADDFARYAEMADKAASATVHCIATFETPEGAEPCGRSVVGETDYCLEHIGAVQEATA